MTWNDFSGEKQNNIKQKISTAQKLRGSKLTEPERSKLSHKMKKCNPMTRLEIAQKIRTALTGVPKTEQHKKNISKYG